MSHQLHSQNLRRRFSGRGGAFHQFDATPFAAATGVNLGFDDHSTTELVSDLFGLLRSRRDLPVGHGDTVAAQNILRLKLVDFHS